MAKIIKRLDYEMFSNKIYNIVCFCANCDPNGEGGHGGVLANGSSDFFIEHQKQFSKFCPTCGTPIHWDTDEIVIRENYIR